MKITIFGATGGTGVEVVRQACEAGHDVTAVVRDPARLHAESPHLTVVAADAMSPAAIGPAILGADVVVTAIGGRSFKPTTLQSDSTTAIIKAMRETGARRLIAVSNSGMFTDGDTLVSKAIVKPILRRILRNPWADMRQMEAIVRASDLDWTLIRPPKLTDGSLTRKYRTAVNRNVRGGMQVSRADVGHLIVDCFDNLASVRSAISLGY